LSGREISDDKLFEAVKTGDIGDIREAATWGLAMSEEVAKSLLSRFSPLNSPTIE
jgi:hypothetical protein